MRARYYETWGVFLGMARSCMGGVIVAWPDGRLEWTWDHTDIRRLLETGEGHNYGELQ